MLPCSTVAGQSQQRRQCMWLPLGETRGMLSSNLAHPRGAPALADGRLGDLALPTPTPSPSHRRKAAGRSHAPSQGTAVLPGTLRSIEQPSGFKRQQVAAGGGKDTPTQGWG